MKNDFIISTEVVENNFEDYINTEGNQRVFFSGKFGVGKTFFLDRFFEVKKESFETFHLYPVDYQISSNENIIDLIKYDVLLGLVKKDATIFSGTNELGVKESSLVFYEWFKNRYTFNDVLSKTLNSLESLSQLSPFIALGRPLQDILAMDKEFQIFKKDLLSGEKDNVHEYLNSIEKENIKEHDYISHLIKEKIVKLKNNKKSVLIIDDLDRIDPDHIFRILNVLSSRFKGENNTFGFDHIILVGDINNIKSIFHHKYGEKTDFEGYINKFFSNTPYILDNRKAVLSMINPIIGNLKCEDESLKPAIGNSGYIRIFITDILSRLVNLDEVSIRQIYRPTEVAFPVLKNSGNFDTFFGNETFAKNTDVAVKLLIAMLGNNQNQILSKIDVILNSLSIKQNMPYRQYLCVFLSNKKCFPDFSSEGTHIYKGISFTLSNNTGNRMVAVTGTVKDENILFFNALREYIQKKGYEKENNYDYSD